jgi:hypothetical protein
MPSPNLAVTHVAAAQNQKEVTINDAIDALDNAMNQALSLAMADANLTLTGTQANRNGLIILTGTLTASRTLTLPANHRRLAIRNATNGGQDVRAKYAGSGAEVVIAPSATVLVQGNGSDLYGIGGGGLPADISGYKAGQPAADEVIARVPVVRRIRLKIDLAGSHASAETAATASADFDIRVDAVSSATMRFAAAATSATFIAASEAVLEPGQVLSVVAPSTPDATLAGIGFTLAGSLVL